MVSCLQRCRVAALPSHRDRPVPICSVDPSRPGADIGRPDFTALKLPVEQPRSHLSEDPRLGDTPAGSRRPEDGRARRSKHCLNRASHHKHVAKPSGCVFSGSKDGAAPHAGSMLTQPGSALIERPNEPEAMRQGPAGSRAWQRQFEFLCTANLLGQVADSQDVTALPWVLPGTSPFGCLPDRSSSPRRRGSPSRAPSPPRADAPLAPGYCPIH